MLDAWEPNCVLLEGLPETPIESASDEQMQLPVAAVAYKSDDPSKSVFAPFAEFSPEWVGLNWALKRQAVVRFIDMPAAHLFARTWPEDRPPFDPFALIGEALDSFDGELWWDDQIEAHEGSSELFESVSELIRELRGDEAIGEFDALREAFMRLGIRQAIKAGKSRIAVVVGAWHLPAVERWQDISASVDEELVARLPRVEVQASWVPWSYDRLTRASGYGAGVLSPSYYEHRWRTPPAERTTRWLARAAEVLRSEQMDTSPASIIEAARLAELLSAIRKRREPGLGELMEAIQSVMADGRGEILRLIHKELVVGSRIGSIPPNLPSVPLVRDYEHETRRLKLIKSGEVEFDIRKPLDLERSRFLMRLSAIDVPLATRLEDPRQLGTFRERWLLDPAPELALRLVDASRYGNTVREATESRLIEELDELRSLSELSKKVEVSMLADLPNAALAAVERLEQVGAASSDVPGMLESIAVIAWVLRIGSAREVNASPLVGLLDRFVLRSTVGLPGASVGTNEEEGERLGALITPVAGAIDGLLPPTTSESWRKALLETIKLSGLSGHLAGRLERHLADLQLTSFEDQALAFTRALSPGNSHEWSSSWIHGFLGDSATALLYNQAFFDLLDNWVTGLDDRVFDESLPLLRRSFSAFPKAERRQLAQRVAHGATAKAETEMDKERLDKVNSALDELFGGLG